MANEVQVVQGKVFVPNFTMFTGEKLIHTTQTFLENDLFGVQMFRH